MDKTLNVEKLAQLLREREWSQRNLARVTGLSEGGISLIMNGKRTNPDYRSLKLISDALGVSPDDLMSNKPMLLSS